MPANAAGTTLMKKQTAHKLPHKPKYVLHNEFENTQSEPIFRSEPSLFKIRPAQKKI